MINFWEYCEKNLNNNLFYNINCSIEISGLKSSTITPDAVSLKVKILPFLSEKYNSPDSDSPNEDTDILSLPVNEVLALLS